jgi:hypothetical protein
MQQADNDKAGEEVCEERVRERADIAKRKADMERRRVEKAEEWKMKESRKHERLVRKRILEMEKQKMRQEKLARKEAAAAAEAAKVPRFLWTETASLQVCGIL